MEYVLAVKEKSQPLLRTSTMSQQCYTSENLSLSRIHPTTNIVLENKTNIWITIKSNTSTYVNVRIIHACRLKIYFSTQVLGGPLEADGFDKNVAPLLSFIHRQFLFFIFQKLRYNFPFKRKIH